MKGHAVAVLIITPQGIPLVRDPKKPAPVFWKLPGGRSEGTETAKNCAVREIKEETGLTLSENDLEVIHEEDRGTHTLTIFKTDLTSLPQLKSQGNGGEEINIFSPQEIVNMPDFFPNHRKVVEKML